MRKKTVKTQAHLKLKQRKETFTELRDNNSLSSIPVDLNLTQRKTLECSKYPGTSSQILSLTNTKN